MFWFFKKKSKKERLLEKYNKLLKESYKLSSINRKDSDSKMFEANEILKKIEELKENEIWTKSNTKTGNSDGVIWRYLF